MEQPSFLLSSETWPNLIKSIKENQVERNKKCDICPFVTHKNQNLKNHKKIHEKVTPIIHECKESTECIKRKSSNSPLARPN